MRKMPQIPVVGKEIRMTSTFLGYNHAEVLRDGEMYDTQNLSGDAYPSLGLRRKRGITTFGTGAANLLTGINGRDQLTFIRGSKVYYNLMEVDGLTVSTDENMCPKRIVNFGAYVCIFPDKVYFNTVNLNDVGSMERKFSVNGVDVSMSLCRGDGTDYDMTQITVSATEPASPENGQLWIDQSGSADMLRQYTASTDEWTEVPNVYVKISASNIGTGLREYDAVDISGLEAVAGASQRVKDEVAALNGSVLVYAAGGGYIVVAGILSATQALLKSQTVRVDLTIPDMDYLTESNNRLWGCKYGLVNGSVVNEIYCSALGDFRNWKRRMGNSQDSYTVGVGTDGPFTAAVTQKGYPVFLKENCIHQVFGNAPSSYQVNTVLCRGCQDGSGRSAVVVNEQVYYKSRTDVMMFDGSMPISVSQQLGDILYSSARAGTVDGKYYISMKDKNDIWYLFTYDTTNGVWYREDNFHALAFGKVDDELYAIDEENNTLVSMLGSFGFQEEDFTWKAEMGISGVSSYGGRREDTPGARYLSRFDIRLYMEENSEIELFIMYNSDGNWESKGVIRCTNMRTQMVPVIPKRCDHCRIKLVGTGECRIYSISRVMEVGADG